MFCYVDVQYKFVNTIYFSINYIWIVHIDENPETKQIIIIRENYKDFFRENTVTYLLEFVWFDSDS